MNRYSYIFLLLLISYSLSGQRVTVSEEINVRNVESFHILGKVGEQIISYRNDGKIQTVSVYNDNLRHLYDKELVLSEERNRIYAVVPQDTTFNVFYSYRNKGGFSLRIAKFNQFATKIDTAIVIDSSSNYKLSDMRYTLSEDQSKTLLFAKIKKDVMHFYVFDNQTMDVLWNKEVALSSFNLNDSFRKIFLTDEGQVNILLQNNNEPRSRDRHRLTLIGLDEREGHFENYFSFDNKVTVDLECQYDAKNQNIIISGLCSEKSTTNATGYFYFVHPLNNLADEMLIEDRDFDAVFLSELYGEKLGRKKDLGNFVVRDIIPRADGGFLLVTEMHKEFYRRSQYNNVGRYSSFGGGPGWLDTYNEDIVIIAIHPDGKEHWKTILYKKQFAQDDDHVYSSFFSFLTPSRLKVIYNDEIRKSNTVSEYVVDPLGAYKRNSVLSTEYQNLKLIFTEAKQVSPYAFIVPSEKNLMVKLVKIDYSEGS